MFLVAWQDQGCKVGWEIQGMRHLDWVGRFLKASAFLDQVSHTLQRGRCGDV